MRRHEHSLLRVAPRLVQGVWCPTLITSTEVERPAPVSRADPARLARGVPVIGILQERFSRS
ncbi:MAG: hypothetical protein R6V51_00495 [Dehalococcoidia bacterium]